MKKSNGKNKYNVPFNNEGFIIVKNLIPKKYILRVLETLELFKKDNNYYYTQSNHEWVRSGKISKEGFLIDSIQSPTKQKNCGSLKFAVEEAISCKEISNILTQISGINKFINWQNMLFDKSTGTLDHADTWYLDTKPRGQMIAAWIALEDINENAGRFFVYPKSHKLEIKENFTKEIKENYEYAEFIKNYIKEHNLKRYAPELKKGDVLFWHPFTIHGSYTQKSNLYSRKSLTAHYHPIGAFRIETAEKNHQVKKYIKRMRNSSNPSIYFDNSDPSDFQFTTISFTKWFIKKLLRKELKSNKNIMSREILKKD